MFRQRLAMILFLLSVCVYQIHAQTSTILVDFGSNPSAAPWINLSAQRTGIIQNLTDSLGIPTNMSLEVFDAFNGINTNGTQNPDPSLGIPIRLPATAFLAIPSLFRAALRLREVSGYPIWILKKSIP